MSPVEEKPVGSEAAESYVVAEGKKRGSTREVRMAARENRWYKVAKVHGGDAILTDNWHTHEVLSHLRAHFEGHTFAERTLEAWGARVEEGREDTAYYTAGGRVWVLELVDAKSKAQNAGAASVIAAGTTGGGTTAASVGATAAQGTKKATSGGPERSTNAQTKSKPARKPRKKS